MEYTQQARLGHRESAQAITDITYSENKGKIAQSLKLLYRRYNNF